jgi:hypothetical protein
VRSASDSFHSTRAASSSQQICALPQRAALLSFLSEIKSRAKRSELMRTNLALARTRTLTRTLTLSCHSPHLNVSHLCTSNLVSLPPPFTLTPAPVPGATRRRAAGGPPPASWA